MSAPTYTCPMSRKQVVDAYFLEHRAKLLDLAAFLDRLERADPQGESAEDFRVAALRKAVAILDDGKPDRARRVLESFSDPSTAPIPKAPMKGALGAYDGGAR